MRDRWPLLAPGWLLGLVVALDLAWTELVAQVFARGWLEPISEATGALVHRSLIANLVPLAVLLGFLLRVRRLEPAKLGLGRSSLLEGAAATAALWLLVQAVAVVQRLATGESLSAHPDFTEPGAMAVIGRLVGQLFGNAPYEEILYRAFLFGGILGILFAKRPAARRKNVIIALIVSQLAFTARHIPAGIHNDLGALELAVWLAVVLALGVTFALLYQRTRSIVFVAGFHALFNRPTELFASAVPAQVVLLVGAIALAWRWPRPHPSPRNTPFRG